MNNFLIEQGQKDIYKLRDILQIEMLRAYRRDCEREDLEKSLVNLEIQLGKVEGLI